MLVSPERAAELPAFILFLKEEAKDRQELDRYGELVGASLDGHVATILAAYGAQQVLEGPPTEGVVILRFPAWRLPGAGT